MRDSRDTDTTHDRTRRHHPRQASTGGRTQRSQGLEPVPGQVEGPDADEVMKMADEV